jgi:hypothetical protein
VSDVNNFEGSAKELGVTSLASSELSATLDSLFSSSESAGDENQLPLPCNLENSLASFKTLSCLSSHTAAASPLSTQSTPLKSS